MTMLRLLLFVTAVTAVKASHFSGLEGHGFYSEPKLISESIHLREIPTKIIKVTKTNLIKIPVPYPVKIPHHIPVPVPVNHPVAVPYPKLVKVPEHVPVEVSRPIPIPIHQQVPVLVPKTVAIPQPVPVPHAVTLNKSIFYPVPHPIPYQSESHSDGGYGEYVGLSSRGEDRTAHESGAYSAYSLSDQGHGGSYDQEAGDDQSFQPSQPDYSSSH